jgi:hypothetical protein
MRIRNTGLKQGKIRHGYKHGATRTFFLVWYWYTPVLAISSPVALTSSFSTGMSPVWWPTFTHTKLSFKTDPSCWVKISNMVPVLYSMYYSVASLLSDKRKKNLLLRCRLRRCSAALLLRVINGHYISFIEYINALQWLMTLFLSINASSSYGFEKATARSHQRLV